MPGFSSDYKAIKQEMRKAPVNGKQYDGEIARKVAVLKKFSNWISSRHNIFAP